MRRSTRVPIFRAEDWAAGTNTGPPTVANGRARATLTGASNPRISRRVSGLTEAATYRVQSNVYLGTATQCFYRVSATQTLSAGDYLALGGFTEDTAVNSTFTAPAGGVVYIGVVGLTSGPDQYVETDDHFDLSREE